MTQARQILNSASKKLFNKLKGSTILLITCLNLFGNFVVSLAKNGYFYGVSPLRFA